MAGIRPTGADMPSAAVFRPLFLPERAVLIAQIKRGKTVCPPQGVRPHAEDRRRGQSRAVYAFWLSR